MSELDFRALTDEIMESAKAAFDVVRKNHPDDKLISFALYSDYGGSIFTPAVNTAGHLKEKSEADSDLAAKLKWTPEEWAFDNEGSDQMMAVNDKINNAGFEIESDDDFDDFRRLLFETSVTALYKLKADGYWDEDGEDVAVMFAISNDQKARRDRDWFSRLNDGKNCNEYDEYVKSW